MTETLLTGGIEDAGGPGPQGASHDAGVSDAQGSPPPSAPSAPASPPATGKVFLHQFEGEEWAADPSITKFASEDGSLDVGVLAKSYTHAQQLIGKDKIVVPESDDDWSEVYDRLGRPETPDAYEFERPELPEGVDAIYSEDTEAHFREVAHGLGLNQRQAKEAYSALIAQRLEEIGQYTKDSAAQKEQAMQALRREQGENFDAFMGQAKAAIKEFADPGYVEYLEQSGQGNDPRVIRMWAKVGKELKGERNLDNAAAGSTPANIQAEIDAYIDKHGAAIDNPDHPDFKRHKSHLNTLYQRLYGDQ